MALDVPGVRPAVLGEPALQALVPYLGFRHRFRNLYLFDLRPEPILGLLAGLPEAWDTVRADLDAFVTFLRELAETQDD